ncbi:nucleoside deaminase [Micromonospora sp. NPDC005305]|uniref:nucleoside deaminase n=1 Tax=Micromonospora sp. NPDC005305 TaxID=3156875 RepID=UPI00339EE417
MREDRAGRQVGRTNQGLGPAARGRQQSSSSPQEVGRWLAALPGAQPVLAGARHAGRNLGRHLFEDRVMYASTEPCPMCLMACYWARIPRLIFGASSHDVATYGFEDLQFYREVALPADRRSLREEVADAALRDQAVDVLRKWADMLPSSVEPKF